MIDATVLAEGAGLRPTSQRVAIIEALDGKKRPVTAQALREELRGPGAPGLATVYRTLKALADAGIVETFEAEPGEAAYKLCEIVHHHHLICQSCGDVQTIPSCEVEDWAAAVAKRRGFRVTGHRADVYGLCARCSRRAG